MHKFFILLITLSLFSPIHFIHADETLTIGDNLFQVKLAVTREEHARGLKHIQSLDSNQGMLFIFANPQQLSFWMKDTEIPLDILFFDQEGRLLEIFKDIPPCKHCPCTAYKNQQPAQYVLELAAGASDRLQLKPGDKFTTGSR